MTYENREMVSSNFGDAKPSAYMFCNGSCMFFDQEGNQIRKLQIKGLSGLKKFLKKYPDAKVYWSVFRESNHLIHADCLPYLLKHLKG